MEKRLNKIQDVLSRNAATSIEIFWFCQRMKSINKLKESKSLKGIK